MLSPRLSIFVQNFCKKIENLPISQENAEKKWKISQFLVDNSTFL